MFELALHGWDIRSSLDIQPSLSYESIPVLMEFASLNRAGLIQPTSPLPNLARYRLHLTGVATGDHDIVIEHGEAHAEPAATTAPDAGIETDTETFVLLTTGRIGFEAARDGRASGRGRREPAAAARRPLVQGGLAAVPQVKIWDSATVLRTGAGRRRRFVGPISRGYCRPRPSLGRGSGSPCRPASPAQGSRPRLRGISLARRSPYTS